MNVGSMLGRLTALDLSGAPVELGTLWAREPALVVWVRHYG